MKLPNLPMANLVQKCKQELEKSWEVRIVHAYKERVIKVRIIHAHRESNRVVDMLANAALQCNEGLSVLEDPPLRMTYPLLLA